MACAEERCWRWILKQTRRSCRTSCTEKQPRKSCQRSMTRQPGSILIRIPNPTSRIIRMQRLRSERKPTFRRPENPCRHLLKRLLPREPAQLQRAVLLQMVRLIREQMQQPVLMRQPGREQCLVPEMTRQVLRLQLRVRLLPLAR